MVKLSGMVKLRLPYDSSELWLNNKENPWCISVTRGLWWGTSHVTATRHADVSFCVAVRYKLWRNPRMGYRHSTPSCGRENEGIGLTQLSKGVATRPSFGTGAHAASQGRVTHSGKCCHTLLHAWDHRHGRLGSLSFTGEKRETNTTAPTQSSDGCNKHRYNIKFGVCRLTRSQYARIKHPQRCLASISALFRAAFLLAD